MSVNYNARRRRGSGHDLLKQSVPLSFQRVHREVIDDLPATPGDWVGNTAYGALEDATLLVNPVNLHTQNSNHSNKGFAAAITPLAHEGHGRSTVIIGDRREASK